MKVAEASGGVAGGGSWAALAVLLESDEWERETGVAR